MKPASSPCPACTESRRIAWVESCPPFEMYRCEACQLQFADPLQWSGDRYEEAYRTRGDALTGEESHYLENIEISRRLLQEGLDLEKVNAFLSVPQRRALHELSRELGRGSSVLDIGCGPGFFLFALRLHCFEPLGVDCASAALEPLQNAGFGVWNGDVKTVARHHAAPAAITLFEVLEHVSDPVSFLSEIRSTFPAAPLFISVPSPRRASLRKIREPADYPPHHLTRWTESALKIVLKRAGYAQVQVLFFPPSPSSFTGSGLGRLAGHFGLRGEEPVREGGRVAADLFTRLRRARLVQQIKNVVYRPYAWLLFLRGYSEVNLLTIARP